MAFIIGIDSGGTHIVGQVIDLDGNVKKSYDSGPGNILGDYEETQKHLIEIITKVEEEHSLKQCVGIVIGIAGLETAGGAPALRTNLMKQFEVPVILMSDATLGLWNILSGHEGVLVLSGTGSAVFSRYDNNIERIGGWGYLVGDEGSAYDIVRRTLKLITNNYDNRSNTKFTNAFVEEAGEENLKELISQVYASNRKEIASLAVVTVKLSRQYSEARQIIIDSASSLAKQVILMMQRYPLKRKFLVGESGSVLQKNDYYRSIFEHEILNFNQYTEFITTDRNNASGAFYWYKQNKGEL